MDIIIDGSFRSDNRIEAALNAVQERARVRRLSLSDLKADVAEAERRLTRAGVPKKYWPGVLVRVDPYRVPLSYRYFAETTVATVTYRARKWRLVNVERIRCARESHGNSHADPRVTVPVHDESVLLQAMFNKHGLRTADTL